MACRKETTTTRSGILLDAVGATAGWSPALVDHFQLLLDWTRPVDWLPGSRPIVWLSVSETAYRLGISTSQVRRNEAAMHRLGAIAWKDSPNHRRYGTRNDAGEIEDAWGVNLAPAAALVPSFASFSERRSEDRDPAAPSPPRRRRRPRTPRHGDRDRSRRGRFDACSAEAWRRLVAEAAGDKQDRLYLDDLERRLHRLDHLDIVLQDELAAEEKPVEPSPAGKPEDIPDGVENPAEPVVRWPRLFGQSDGRVKVYSG